MKRLGELRLLVILVSTTCVLCMPQNPTARYPEENTQHKNTNIHNELFYVTQNTRASTNQIIQNKTATEINSIQRQNPVEIVSNYSEKINAIHHQTLLDIVSNYSEKIIAIQHQTPLEIVSNYSVGHSETNFHTPESLNNLSSVSLKNDEIGNTTKYLDDENQPKSKSLVFEEEAKNVNNDPNNYVTDHKIGFGLKVTKDEAQNLNNGSKNYVIDNNHLNNDSKNNVINIKNLDIDSKNNVRDHKMSFGNTVKDESQNANENTFVKTELIKISSSSDNNVGTSRAISSESKSQEWISNAKSNKNTRYNSRQTNNMQMINLVSNKTFSLKKVEIVSNRTSIKSKVENIVKPINNYTAIKQESLGQQRKTQHFKINDVKSSESKVEENVVESKRNSTINNRSSLDQPRNVVESKTNSTINKRSSSDQPRNVVETKTNSTIKKRSSLDQTRNVVESKTNSTIKKRSSLDQLRKTQHSKLNDGKPSGSKVEENVVENNKNSTINRRSSLDQARKTQHFKINVKPSLDDNKIIMSFVNATLNDLTLPNSTNVKRIDTVSYQVGTVGSGAGITLHHTNSNSSYKIGTVGSGAKTKKIPTTTQKPRRSTRKKIKKKKPSTSTDGDLKQTDFVLVHIPSPDPMPEVTSYSPQYNPGGGTRPNSNFDDGEVINNIVPLSAVETSSNGYPSFEEEDEGGIPLNLPLGQFNFDVIPDENPIGGVRCPEFHLSSNAFGPQMKQACPDINIVLNSHYSQSMITDRTPIAEGNAPVPTIQAAPVEAVADPAEAAAAGVASAPTQAAAAPAAATAPVSSGGGGSSGIAGLPPLGFPNLPGLPDLKGLFDILGGLGGLLGNGWNLLVRFGQWIWPVLVAIPVFIFFKSLAVAFFAFFPVWIPALWWAVQPQKKKSEHAYYKHVHKPVHHPDGWFWNHNTKTWTNVEEYAHKHGGARPYRGRRRRRNVNPRDLNEQKLNIEDPSENIESNPKMKIKELNSDRTSRNNEQLGKNLERTSKKIEEVENNPKRISMKIKAIKINAERTSKNIEELNKNQERYSKQIEEVEKNPKGTSRKAKAIKMNPERTSRKIEELEKKHERTSKKIKAIKMNPERASRKFDELERNRERTSNKIEEVEKNTKRISRKIKVITVNPKTTSRNIEELNKNQERKSKQIEEVEKIPKGISRKAQAIKMNPEITSRKIEELKKKHKRTSKKIKATNPERASRKSFENPEKASRNFDELKRNHERTSNKIEEIEKNLKRALFLAITMNPERTSRKIDELENPERTSKKIKELKTNLERNSKKIEEMENNPERKLRNIDEISKRNKIVAKTKQFISVETNRYFPQTTSLYKNSEQDELGKMEKKANFLDKLVNLKKPIKKYNIPDVLKDFKKHALRLNELTEKHEENTLGIEKWDKRPVFTNIPGRIERLEVNPERIEELEKIPRIIEKFAVKYKMR